MNDEAPLGIRFKGDADSGNGDSPGGNGRRLETSSNLVSSSEYDWDPVKKPWNWVTVSTTQKPSYSLQSGSNVLHISSSKQDVNIMKVRLTGSNGVSPTFKAKQTTTIPAKEGRTTTDVIVV
jgi:hypothetical protein